MGVKMQDVFPRLGGISAEVFPRLWSIEDLNRDLPANCRKVGRLRLTRWVR
jgi:hypothetical protein